MEDKDAKIQITYFVKDTLAFRLVLLSIIFNAFFTLNVLNNMSFSWRILSFSLYSIFLTLISFYLGSNMQIYKMKSSKILLLLNLINILRLFFIPQTNEPLLPILMLALSTALGIIASVYSINLINQRNKLSKKEGYLDGINWIY